jgi:hypothetical protein
MEIGDTVKLVRLPENLPRGDAALPTLAVFEECLGHEFAIVGFNEIGWAELDIEPNYRQRWRSRLGGT